MQVIEGFRLSPQQKRLWLLQLTSPGYCIQCAVLINGALSKNVLSRAFQQLIDRHEILRTAFQSVPGMDVPLQVVRGHSALNLIELDISALRPQEQETRLEELLICDRNIAFKYEQGEVVRAYLLKLEEQRHVLLIVLASLCADIWTAKNIVREICELYDACLYDIQLANEAIQYADFCEWQNELLEANGKNEATTFWRKQASDLYGNVESHEERLLAESKNHSIQTALTYVLKELRAEIEQLAKAQQISPAVFFLGCWHAFLWRLMRQPRMVVNVAFDGRKFNYLYNAIGLYTKYLPIVCDFDNIHQFDEVLKNVGDSLNNAYAKQEFYPFDEVLKINARPESNITRLSSLMGFEYEELPAPYQAAGLSFTIHSLYKHIEYFKLMLSCISKGNIFVIKLQYDATQYSSETIDRISEGYVSLVKQVLLSPQTLICHLDILSQSERQQTLVDWNLTHQPFPREQCVQQLFCSQVERTPDQLALICGERRLSYRELNRRANQLAHYLRSLGVGPEAMIGLCLERSIEMVIAVLGVLKAGGAYLPLDPEYPLERLSYMLEDAGAVALLSEERLAERLPAHWGRTVLLDAESESVNAQSCDEPESGVGAENLAYVIYTSGSTGRPKGVMVERRSITNLFFALRQTVFGETSPPLRLTLNAPLSFDASVKQLLRLLAGDTLWIVPEEVRRDPSELLKQLDYHQVEVLDCTPSYLRLLLKEGLGKRYGLTLKKVLVGGEAIERELWASLGGQGRVAYFNLYGPTECAVDVSSRLIESPDSTPSIGRPLANAQVYLLDGWLQPVPIGQVGELFVGGAGLARGYRREAGLSAERFIPHPYSNQAGMRLYRTGDLARYRPDGELEFVGRSDAQVKVRGFRVELGEIEAALDRHPAVRESVVLAREDAPGDQRLVAYLVARHQGAKLMERASRYRLPNGMAIFHQNRMETDYMYQEIFEDQIYLRHGVRLSEGDCVFDVGANIGLFTLYVGSHCRRARIYAFEPIGAVCELLRRNAALHGVRVEVFEQGLAESEREAAFTYYPQYSARSGLSAYADERDEVEVIKTFLRNQAGQGQNGAGQLLEMADELLAGTFHSESHQCAVRRLSEVIREQAIERVDLLKIDVQRAEYDVLQGIDAKDWARIRQIVMEAHDLEGPGRGGRVDQIRDLLEGRGYQVEVEQEAELKGTDRYHLYAVRPEMVEARAEAVKERWPGWEQEEGGENQGSYCLPNGLEIFHQNRNETEFIYQQIFEDEIYLRNGIRLEEGDCVFDVGANIGLFTLYLYQRFRDIEVYSFEPIPANYERLRRNVALYGLPARLYQCGLSNRDGEAEFTYYPKWTASSGLYADMKQEEETFKTYLRNQGPEAAHYAEQLAEGRYEGERIVGRIRRLSEIMREAAIKRIDLLKLDVEKSELDVLKGIEKEDWPKIRQLVIEAHDLNGQLKRIVGKLEEEGYQVVIRQDDQLKETGIYSLYARRETRSEELFNESVRPRMDGEREWRAEMEMSMGEALNRELSSYLRQTLPEYMVPGAYVLLDRMPLNRHGKVDRGSLKPPEEVKSAEGKKPAEARGAVEIILAGLWKEVLKAQEVGVDENFFELGGHSLLATQLISRVRSSFDREIPLRSLFERPTVAGLAQVVEEALRGEAIGKAPAIKAVVREARLPLSFAQQRLWFLQQLEPDSRLYNNPMTVRLQGKPDLRALEKTLSEIVRRHEVLRTSFETVEGEAAQVIHPAEPLRLPLLDLSGLEQGGREPEARKLAREEARRPFDLTKGPMLRASLVRLSEEDHLALLTMHHIVSDGWSMGILIREVGELYEAYSRGEESPLEELPIQYADFAVWQREWLRGEALESELGYWRRQLEGMETLELPTDRPRPAVRSYRGGRSRFELSKEESEGLKDLSEREGATLFMTLLAGFEVLMSRYSGQEDIALGTDIANRNRSEIEGLIGFFVNQLVLRVGVKNEESFKGLLKRVKEVCLGAYVHQDLPFEKLVEEMAPERDLSRSPMFQVKMILQNAPRGELELGGLKLGGVVGEADQARFEMTVSLMESGERLSGLVEYSRDLFEEGTIERLIGHYASLLRGIVEDSEQEVGSLRLLSDAEREQMLAEWNQTRQPYPEEECVHELFAAQAERTPERVALICGERHLNYGELNRRANRLAHYLRSLGVGPEALVGLCLERSIEMVIAVLGVLKAGGAYLPLDPEYPLERLSYMLEDAGAVALLSEERLAERLPAHWGRTVLLDAESESVSAQSCDEPESGVQTENLAYVIYTSGSTGRPKGVMVPHRGLVNYLCWAVETYEIAKGRGAPLHSSLSFDLTVTSLFGPILVGSSIHLLEEDRDLESLGNAFRARAEYSFVKLTPTHLQMLSGQLSPQDVRGSSLALILGGENLTVEAARFWRESARAMRFYNEYGPTETVVGCSLYEVGELGSRRGSIPIGKPAANAELYILDRSQRPVPVGVRGELYIGGAGVSRGYLGRVELSAEKFIPHPFSEESGARLYRTGDLARYQEDGNIEFLGRVDEQVKLRGYRIELGEIEAVIHKYPGILDAAVVVRGEKTDDQRLTAYVACSQGAEVAPEQLQQYLGERLPQYMVPATIVRLEKLPLTAHGKVDRKALPAPEKEKAESYDDKLESLTPVEEMVAGVWRQVLGLRGVMSKSNFFEMGGHSLLATQVIARVREVFGVEAPLRDLFEQPTVSGFARRISEAISEAKGVQTPPIRRISREGRLPLSFAQQRLWFLAQLEPENSFYNCPAAVRLQGWLDLKALGETLSEIVRRHEVLRTSFETVEGEAAQVIHPATPLRLPLVDLGGLKESRREAEAKNLAREEAQRPFDLTKGPMLRVSLVRLSEEDHLALLTMHHIVSDGWSMGILIREVGELYEAYSRGEESPLEELPIQYADFAAWQREWLKGDILEAQTQYWKNQLGNFLHVLEFPLDHPRPSIQTFRGGECSFSFSVEVSNALSALSLNQGTTVFMTLLAAFNALLSRYTAQTNIVIGTPIANRRHVEIENLIGFFVNTLALQTSLSDNPTYYTILQRVRHNLLDAYAHQDLPFEKLVEELRPERDLSRNPIYQVNFALHNVPTRALNLPKLKLSNQEILTKTARCDLEIHLWDLQDNIDGLIIYNTDLIEHTTILRLIGHFKTLVEEIIASPATRLSDYQLLPVAERRQILTEWNQVKQPYPEEQCVHELFAAQTERTPERVALIYGERYLNYGELNRRANQLAHYLRSLGVGPEVLVGLCLERSIEMVIAVLGVLKAGGAYLPLDPEYPLERLSYMLEDAGVVALLSEERLAERLPAHSGRTVLLDAESESVNAQSCDEPESGVQTENLAYVIYTSGSTGRPKGVMVPHRGLVNYLCWAVETYEIAKGRGAPLHSSLSFDLTITSLFGPILVGSSIHLLEEDRDLESLGNAFRSRAEYSFVKLTPTHLQMLSGQLSPQDVRGSSLALILGGEDLTVEAARFWRESARVMRLYNEYGPTETVVGCSLYEVEELGARRNSIPIGKPAANAELYILDRSQRPVPVGVRGELYIGGAGVSRGYLGRAELSAEKFIPHPFSEESGARLYRTGDLARYQEDGNIEFLGRVDEQVKLRGYRIELGEIEAALNRHPGVLSTAVIARDKNDGIKQLFAYVVPKVDTFLSDQQDGALQSQQILQWQSLYDATYTDIQPQIDEAFNIAGWVSSYTGLPIPADEMREWQNATVERILSLKPKRVLEIGCGTGLLLLKCAQHCELYWGTDFSQAALQYLNERLESKEYRGMHIELLHREADNFEGIDTQLFDCVILNSVVQYFPSLAYFLRVLEGAVSVVKPGGVIFLGDIRHLGLLEAFQTSVQLYQSSSSLETDILRQKVQQRILLEEELLIDPGLFTTLKSLYPQLSQIEVHLKRGRYHNELTCFRYDAILHVRADKTSEPADLCLNWQKGELTLVSLEELLVEKEPDSLLIREIPNARTRDATLALEVLNRKDAPNTVGDLRRLLHPHTHAGVDPEDIWALGDRLPYAIDISWSQAGSGEGFNALFRRRGANAKFKGLNFGPDRLPAEKYAAEKPVNSYVNNPMYGTLTRKLIPQLQKFAKEWLPEYMAPSSFTVLKAMPLTPNGKVNHGMLSLQYQSRSELSDSYVPPGTPMEERLAGIWSEVLGIEQIGANDNFFELGGHSLLATQLISRVRDALAVEVPLRSLFEHPTISELAEIVLQKVLEQENGERAEILNMLLALSEDEVEIELNKRKYCN